MRPIGRIFLLTALLTALAMPLVAMAAGSTQVVVSKADGLHITRKTTDKWASHGATPTVQQAATVTAYAACQAKGIIAAGQDYSVQHATVAVSAAEIIAMYTTPKLLVAAPGAGKSIVVTKVALTMTRTATAFTGGGVGIVQYDSTANGAGLQALDSTVAAAVVTGAAGTTLTFRNGAVISDAAAATIQNKGLYLSNQTAVFATGTGTLLVDVWFLVY